MAGLIASLVFVGLELRQSREIAIADIYQQRSAMLIEVHAIRLSSDLLHDTISKVTAGESLTDAEQGLLTTAFLPMFSYWENNHFQYQMGLMPEEQWNASRNAMRNYIGRAGFLEWWQGERLRVRKSFADAVDEVIEEQIAKQK
jgi:hypothetical protein